MTKAEIKRLQAMPPLERAIALHTMAGLSKALGLKHRSNVNVWRERGVPDEYHARIEAVCDGRVMAEEFYYDQVLEMRHTHRYVTRARLANNKTVAGWNGA